MPQMWIVQAAVLLVCGVHANAHAQTVENTETGSSEKAYILSEISATDVAAYNEYLRQVFPILTRFGGRVVITPFQPKQSIEGESIKGRIAVIEFPSAAARDAFWNSEEYQAVKPLRLENTTSRIIHINP
ncbi:DUF1330 domain-containing protein [Erythrobacter sp. YT30]|uniref:DUF1330 domain-containing protein n=1 Tax=Erythrobacter sp. YT30 TaxID=1735012 RepID=UPI00076C08C9|nr:DUF1330 domain-containing protein [Erythrobacter sp. YT30]KWV90459.1 hypothetical protein AUC45_14550 [Erythrobacter sp. YT30]